MHVRAHPVSSNKVVIVIGGVDGSADGYQDKYVKMADRIVNRQNKAVLRVSNYFISSFHWEDNLRQALEYVRINAVSLCEVTEPDIEIVAHSAGASVVSWIAHEFPQVTQILLINTASRLKKEKILDGLEKFNGHATLVFGENDESLDLVKLVSEKNRVVIIDGADHHFANKPLQTFIELVDILK